MRLLIDTDVFCKVGQCGFLDDVLAIFGATKSDCGRLAALPHMLKRGRLRKQLGVAVCDNLISQAEALPVLPDPELSLLDMLNPIADIDPGEAQIFALAAQRTLMVITGDKRALSAVKSLGFFCEKLNGRVVVLEAILIHLTSQLGVEFIRHRIKPLRSIDTCIRICFSSNNADPIAGLKSYYAALAKDVEPLRLWKPDL